MSTVPSLIAGDDWDLRFTILNPDGTPFDLSGSPEIMWTMIDKNNKRIIQTEEVNSFVTDAAQGECSVLVPSAISTRLTSDVYGHALRIVSGGITATPFSGSMYIMADPWLVPSAQVLWLKTSHSQFVAVNQLRAA